MTSDLNILHIDMDAFFASVEQRDQPALRGKPVLVGHDGSRGVVAAASYEARVFGCHSAMPMVRAKRLCPQAIIVAGRHSQYSAVSRQVFAILEDFTPIVEPVSIDEAYIDLAGTQRLLGEPIDVARRIKDRIQNELHLTASIGVAPNKFLAKLASDMEKPDGLTVIAARDVDKVLLPLPVGKLWGIGPKTAEKLAARRIHTVADIRNLSKDELDRHFGSDAQRFHDLCRGIDSRQVICDRSVKSISHEQTFGVDEANPEVVLRVLADQVDLVAQRLRRKGFFARGVSLKIRFGNFQTINRSGTLPRPTQTTSDLWALAREIFQSWPFEPVRLIGFGAERLSGSEGQLALFEDEAERTQKQIDAVSDRINQKFGKRAIQRGVSR